MCKTTPSSSKGDKQTVTVGTLKLVIYALSTLLLASVTGLIVVSTKSTNDKTACFVETEKGDGMFFWTKLGLEMIPISDWSYFSPDDEDIRPYVSKIPYPADEFTDEHFDTWNLIMGSNSMGELLNNGVISENTGVEMKSLQSVSSVPTLFSDPIFVKESPIDYRIQYAADIGSRDIGEKAIKGRLVNPAGRRLREHFYRFPDQCDATPIALEVFLRMMIYDQVEAFFSYESIGLWHDLFPEVKRRPYNSLDLNIARWYGERYAESYIHKIINGWVYPLPRQNIDSYMLAVGLDPEDTNKDPSTPVGLGNIIGKRTTEWMHNNDGLSRVTDFVDEVGLQRIEERHSEQEWHQWKPTLAGSDRFQGIRVGIVTRQTFVSPSLGIMSFLYDNETDFVNLGLQDAVPILNTTEEAYIERAKEFLDIHRNFTDRQKAVAELSNNKISGSTFLIKAYVPLLKELMKDREEEYPSFYEEFSMVTSGCAEYAATHAAWRHKRTYLAGRPKSVLRELAARNMEFNNLYPEAGTFEAMIPAGDHPEYPSGSTAVYSAFAQSADDWFEKRLGMKDASKKTGYLKFVVPTDKFYWSDGPKEDIELEYESLDMWLQELPLSRVYAGSHWIESGNVGLVLGKRVGRACIRLLDRLRDGDMAATYPSSSRENILAFNPNKK